MKKRIFAAICCVFMFCSCASRAEYVPLEDISAAYMLEDANEDGCVIFKDGDISSGQAIWDEFLAVVDSGEKSMVRLVFYYSLGDPDRYAPEYYEKIKDEYPKMYVKDLSYDGEKYTLRWFEDEEIVRSYKYLMRYEGEPSSQWALFDRYVRYVLVNDNTLTWEDIEYGMFSSQMGDYIDHNTVYVDLQIK